MISPKLLGRCHLIEKSVHMSQASSFEERPFHIDARRCCFPLALGQQTMSLLFLYLVSVVACASAQADRTAPDATAIVSRMAQARAENRARLRPYIVTRDYKLFGKERAKTKAQVIADVSFVPPDSKQYAIEQANGAGLGERIVRRMLESETEVAKDYRLTDFSPDNYEFRFSREEEINGHRCYVLELLPKREEKNLLRGHIWVDASSYLLHRVDGSPAKGPSWWLRDVRIVLVYSDVEGMWLQTTSESTATVRILGQHTMESRDMNYEISEPVAAGSSPPVNLLKEHAPGEFVGNRVINKWIWNVEEELFSLQQLERDMQIEGKRRMF